MQKGWSHLTLFSLLAFRSERMGILPAILLFMTTPPAFFCACSRVEQDALPVTVYISSAQHNMTKAPSWWLIRRVDIFSFDIDNDYALDSYQSNSEQVGRGGLTIYSGEGRRLVVAIANMTLRAEQIESVRTLDDLERLEAELVNDSPEYPIMSGSAQIEAGRDRTCSIGVTPVLCEIDVSLRVELCDELEGVGLEEAQVYFTGASGRAELLRGSGFSPTEILCSGTLSEYDLQRLCYPRMLCQYLGRVPSTVDKMPFRTTLFTYPNEITQESVGSPYTRLVVEALIDGRTYYYPIPLKDLRRAVRYEVDLTLTHPGSSSPDEDVWCQ